MPTAAGMPKTVGGPRRTFRMCFKDPRIDLPRDQQQKDRLGQANHSGRSDVREERDLEDEPDRVSSWLPLYAPTRYHVQNFSETWTLETALPERPKARRRPIAQLRGWPPKSAALQEGTPNHLRFHNSTPPTSTLPTTPGPPRPQTASNAQRCRHVVPEPPRGSSGSLSCIRAAILESSGQRSANNSSQAYKCHCPIQLSMPLPLARD